VRAAERDLRAALEHGPVAAWVDWAELPYRAAPPAFSGGGYHVLVVYAVLGDTAVVGDLAAQPIELPLADLARARARIVKQRNRLLSVRRIADPDPAEAMLAGLRAGAEALATESRRNFSLAAIADLARRMHGSTGADAWGRVFPRGRLLWAGLSSLHRSIETYHTGGGLLRPMAASAARELGALTGDERLDEVATRYDALADAWSALAAAALPDEVALLAETRRIQLAVADAWQQRGAAASDEIRSAWHRLAELEAAADDFPMSDADVDAHLGGLAGRLRAVHADEGAPVRWSPARTGPLTRPTCAVARSTLGARPVGRLAGVLAGDPRWWSCAVLHGSTASRRRAAALDA
jgi:hypothetical protein